MKDEKYSQSFFALTPRFLDGGDATRRHEDVKKIGTIVSYTSIIANTFDQADRDFRSAGARFPEVLIVAHCVKRTSPRWPLDHRAGVRGRAKGQIGF